MFEKNIFCILVKVLTPLFVIWAVIFFFFPEISEGAEISTSLVKTFQPVLVTEKPMVVNIVVKVPVIKGNRETFKGAYAGRGQLSADFMTTAFRQGWSEDYGNAMIDIDGGDVVLNLSVDRNTLWANLKVCQGVYRKNKHKFRENLKNGAEVVQFFKEQLSNAEYCIAHKNNLKE